MMHIKKNFVLDKRNDVHCRIIEWEGSYGARFGYELSVAEADPFVEATGDDSGDGYSTATAAEQEARQMYSSFRPGDELVKGVIKI